MIDFNRVTDEDLYGMCSSGDENAWEYLFNYVLRICEWKKWTLKDQPEEMAQSILFHLIDKAMEKVKYRDKFRNFVKMTAINRIKDSFKDPTLKHRPLEKKIKSSKGEEFVPDYPDDTPSQDMLFIRFEIVSIVDSAIEKLPSHCRKVVKEYLNFKIGLYESYAELSKVLKLPIPTISSKVSRCLAILIEFKEIKQLKQ
jgi:RNA polymerase sigma factor (sigma-70 family)